MERTPSRDKTPAALCQTARLMSETDSRTLQAALREAHTLLRAGRAATAEGALRALEARTPGDARCLWLLGAALLYQDRLPESLTHLERALAVRADLLDARVDRARALTRARRLSEAREEVRRVLTADAHHHGAWLAYGDVLVELEQLEDARVAFERARLTDPCRARIEQATTALLADDRKSAENIFREILLEDASHVGALVGLAMLSTTADRPEDAERLLRHALKQSQHVPLAYRALGPALQALGKLQEADAAARHLLKLEPDNPQSWITIAAVAARLMRQEQALEAYQHAARLKPDEVRLQMSIGHVQKTLGHRVESEAAYKAALRLAPELGEAYWSLADLKNYAFSDTELAEIQRLLKSPQQQPSNEAQLRFALGRALEQRARYADAFAQYAAGNALRAHEAPFDIEAFEARSGRIRTFFNAAFFRGPASHGDPSRAPIFIVGLPRSGSTLIEQILASHSQVEGTMELPNVLNYVRELDDLAPARNGYPEALARVPPERLTAVGKRYLAETAPLRRGRERFIDKMPNNFSHVGLIHAMLPNATIIDARRHPLDACFSAYRQYFAEGQTFSYDLEVLGRYYRAYLDLMDHWDQVLPGCVLRLQYERLIENPEARIRELLAHCGLPFEPSCLRFHETRRSVRTASAEQVRQPIYRSAVGYSKHFERELEPLRRSLGDALERCA